MSEGDSLGLTAALTGLKLETDRRFMNGDTTQNRTHAAQTRFIHVLSGQCLPQLFPQLCPQFFHNLSTTFHVTSVVVCVCVV